MELLRGHLPNDLFDIVKSFLVPSDQQLATYFYLIDLDVFATLTESIRAGQFGKANATRLDATCSNLVFHTTEHVAHFVSIYLHAMNRNPTKLITGSINEELNKHLKYAIDKHLIGLIANRTPYSLFSSIIEDWNNIKTYASLRNLDTYAMKQKGKVVLR